MFEIVGKYTTARVYATSLDQGCVAQITAMVNHPAFNRPVAIMPDAHVGKGSVIGFTMELHDRVVPAVVGVDIGCGMLAANIGPNLSVDFPELDRRIRERVPFGFNVHPESTLDGFPWAAASAYWRVFAAACLERLGFSPGIEPYDPDWFAKKIVQIHCPPERARNSLGTLGGGNHFIEIDKDVHSGDLWIVIHSGSRKLGERVCSHWQDRAQHHDWRAEIEKLKELWPARELESRIKALKAARGSANMAWLDLPGEGVEYMRDMLFAQQYASCNRERMLAAILDIVQIEPKDKFECVHNFIDPRDLVVRKGAIRATHQDRCLVPLHMTAGALLGVGRGDASWNYSAPHGAGRALSRAQAKRTLSVERFKAQMAEAGVWSSSVGRSTLDEAPDAYKDWEVIYQDVQDTMQITEHLKPIFSMKDGGEEEDT